MNIIDAGLKGEGAKISLATKPAGRAPERPGLPDIKKGEAKASPFFLPVFNGISPYG